MQSYHSFINDHNLADVGNPGACILVTHLVTGEENWEDNAIINIFDNTIHMLGLDARIWQFMTEHGILSVAVADQLDDIRGYHFRG